MPLREIDRQLLDRCLRKEPNAWNDFVDRYMGLVYHVIHHVSHARSVVLSPADIEDIAAEILLAVVDDDYAILRRFKGNSSLPTYLTVVARRICVRDIIKRGREAELGHTHAHRAGLAAEGSSDEVAAVATKEEVDRMLERLSGREAEVVQLYHLQYLNYRQIGSSPESPRTPWVLSWRRPGRRCVAPRSNAARPENVNPSETAFAEARRSAPGVV